MHGNGRRPWLGADAGPPALAGDAGLWREFAPDRNSGVANIRALRDHLLALGRLSTKRPDLWARHIA